MGLLWLTAAILICSGCQRSTPPGFVKAAKPPAYLDQVSRIDILALDTLPGAPLVFPAQRSATIIIASVRRREDEPDFGSLITEIKDVYTERGDVPAYPCYVTKLWLRLRLRQSNRAYFYMYAPHNGRLAEICSGPADLTTPGGNRMWHTDMHEMIASERFRTTLNRYIPAKWMSVGD